MTSNVIHHLRELQTEWRKQDFVFTKKQQEDYDLLIASRRERVKELYAAGRVQKGAYKPVEDVV